MEKLTWGPKVAPFHAQHDPFVLHLLAWWQPWCRDREENCHDSFSFFFLTSSFKLRPHVTLLIFAAC